MNSSECRNCKFFENGCCTKYRKNGKCDISSEEWFDCEFDYIQLNRMCENSSIFGNYYVGLSQSDIDRLQKGEVIYIGGEYGIFIGCKGGSNNERR